MALDRINGFSHCFRRRQITEPPTCHGVGFAESVDGDGEVVRFFRQRRDADMFEVVVNEFLVNLVGQNVNVFLGRDLNDCLQFFTCINGASRIARAVHDQHLGARCHCIFEVFGPHLPGVALAGGHNHGFGTGQPDHVRVTDPVWRGDDDFVARLACCEDRVVARMLRTVAYDDLGGTIT